MSNIINNTDTAIDIEVTERTASRSSLGEVFDFFRDPDKERLLNLYKEISPYKNYAESTWMSKQPKLYEELVREASNKGLTLKDFKRKLYNLGDIHDTPLYKQFEDIYSKALYQPDFQTCLSVVDFLREGLDKMISISCLRNNFSEFWEILKIVADSECNSDEEILLTFYHKLPKLPACAICGNVVHLKRGQPVPKTCCKECTNLYISNTWASRDSSYIEEAVSKRRNTCYEKYGVCNPNKTKEVREKIKKTCLERYGVEWSTQLESAKEKKRKTFLEKYGTEVPSKTEAVKEKARQTCLRKYGVDNVKKSQWLVNYCKSKYGVDNFNLIGKDPDKILIVKDPIKLRAYFENHPTRSLQDIGNELGFSSYYIASVCREYGLNEFVGKAAGHSNAELSLIEVVKGLVESGTEIRCHDRTCIKPYELDIYIPSKKVAIEFNGNFWHSDHPSVPRVIAAKDTHLSKTLLCKDKGIHLIHVFEYEWNNSREKIIKYLTDILQTDSSKTIVYARNCEVRKISYKEASSFFEENHLQGSCVASNFYGLYEKNSSNDTLLACMSFGKPRFSRKYDWELNRFAVKANYKIPGAAGKLLKAFEREHTGTLIVYSDAAKMTGNTYRAIGLEEQKMSVPNYVWVRGKNVLKRYATQKHKLLKEGYGDLGNTEEEIMRNRGYSRLYDCGNYVFTKEYR